MLLTLIGHCIIYLQDSGIDIIEIVLECISLDSFKIIISSNSFKTLLKIFINLTNSDLLTNYLQFFIKLWSFILVIFASFTVSWNMNRFSLFVDGQAIHLLFGNEFFSYLHSSHFDDQQLLFSDVSHNTSP